MYIFLGYFGVVGLRGCSRSVWSLLLDHTAMVGTSGVGTLDVFAVGITGIIRITLSREGGHSGLLRRAELSTKIYANGLTKLSLSPTPIVLLATGEGFVNWSLLVCAHTMTAGSWLSLPSWPARMRQLDSRLVWPISAAHTEKCAIIIDRWWIRVDG